MNRISKVDAAITVADAARRANVVRQDPAVRKAASEAKRDLTQAAKSTAEFVSETSAAWRRAGN